jgi:phage tail tape-measure protein
MGVPAVSATRIPPQIDPRAVEQARNIALEQATERLPVNPPPVPKTVVSPKPSSSLTSAVNALDNAAEKVIDGGSKAEKGGLFSKMFGPKNVKALEKLATKYPAAAKILKSKALGPAISGVIAVNEISEGKDPAKAIVGDVLGGWAGAEAGLAGGAALGSLAGPIGTAVGGLGGAVLGGMGGAGLANSLLDSLFDRTKEPKQVVDPEEERLNKIALEYAKKRLAAEESPRGRLLDSIGGTGTSTRKYDRQAGRNMRELDRALKSLGR